MLTVKKMRSFVGLTFLGGFMVVLPLVIFVFLLYWLLGLLRSIIRPMSDWLTTWTAMAHLAADLLVIGLLLSLFFVIGLLVRTRMGSWARELMDHWLGKLAPGYSTIREVVMQLIGGEGNASLLNGQVCRAYLMGRVHGVSVTGIITEIHANGDYTVYVPTAPIPTSGFVYHLSADCVDILPHVGVEAAMRTVIACGSGSRILSEIPEVAPSPNRDQV
jgi:uncharacterized membrane protein